VGLKITDTFPSAGLDCRNLLCSAKVLGGILALNEDLVQRLLQN